MKISGNDLESITIIVPYKHSFRYNYNNHIAELQQEIKFLKGFKSNTYESEMLSSQSLAIKTMQLQSGIKAFSL